MYINTEEEVWKDIDGYEGSYQVSNYGRVRSKDRVSFSGRKLKGRVLKQTANKGYYMIGLYKDGKRFSKTVSRLVAKAFIPNPENKPEVNHIDENKANNHANNLEWATAKENANHGTRPDRLRKISIKNKSHKHLFKNDKLRKLNESRKVPVKQIDTETGEVINKFPSRAEANEFLGKKRTSSAISDCLSGKCKTAYGFKWERA